MKRIDEVVSMFKFGADVCALCNRERLLNTDNLCLGCGDDIKEEIDEEEKEMYPDQICNECEDLLSDREIEIGEGLCFDCIQMRDESELEHPDQRGREGKRIDE